MSLKVVSADGKRDIDISVEMVDRIKDVIYDYSDRANLVTVLGVLDIVSRELWSEQSGEYC